jgi:hypothetical protein
MALGASTFSNLGGAAAQGAQIGAYLKFAAAGASLF